MFLVSFFSYGLGLYNLSFILLMFSLVYNVVRNVRENGNLVIMPPMCSRMITEMCLLAGVYVALGVLSLGVYGIVKKKLVEPVEPSRDAKWMVLLLQGVMYFGVGPAVVATEMTPIPGSIAGSTIVLFSLKIHSYYATNFLLAKERAARGTLKAGKKSLFLNRTDSEKNRKMRFPGNVSLGNFTYFMFCAPTLVYETSYPRTPRIRTGYVAWMTFQVLICLVVQYCVSCQLLFPPLIHGSGSLVFDAMRLAIPSIIVWLLGFYALFHALLNAWAELARFADRQFYLDWWNSTTIDAFWNKWNILVHEWCLRHVFVESQTYFNVSRRHAGLATFLFSAILHEYIFFIAFRTPRPAIFTAMMIQVPFMSISQRLNLEGKRRGNLLVWLNLFLGHPLVELMYVRSFLDRNERLFPC